MTAEAIYAKYWAALMDVEAVMVSADTAIALALRLAIADAYAAGLETCSGMDDDLAAIVASQAQALQDAEAERDDLRNQLVAVIESIAELDAGNANLTQRLAGVQADLAAAYARAETTAALHRSEVIGLRQQLTQMDADNADLLNKVHQAQIEIDRLTRQNVIAVSTLNSLTEAHTNGNGAGLDPTTTPAWTRNHPAWEGMTDEQRIAVFELHTDRVKFGELSMELRTEILVRVLRHTMDGTKRLTMAQFDNRKPEWMPIASGLVKVFGGKWPKLLELAAAPA